MRSLSICHAAWLRARPLTVHRARAYLARGEFSAMMQPEVAFARSARRLKPFAGLNCKGAGAGLKVAKDQIECKTTSTRTEANTIELRGIISTVPGRIEGDKLLMKP